MRWWKQALLVLIAVLAALFGWLRTDPGAASKVQQMGVSPSLVALVAGESSDSGEKGNERQGRRPGGFGPTPVITASVGEASINDRASALGDGEALRSVTIVPLTSGVLREVLVKPGDRVKAGSVMARLDSETEEIARDQAALSVRLSEEKVQRYEQLVQSRTVSEVQLSEARNELANAKLGLREAEVDLARRSITAPFDGILGIVPVDVGDYVTQESEIATVDDRSSILVDFWVPERFVAKISEGQDVDAAAIALPGRTFPGKVSEIASRVDKDSRTLQVRARVDNSQDTLRPGMSFRVNLRFPGEDYVAVDPLAIQWSSNGPFVWRAANEKAERVAVEIIQRNSDYVLVTGDLNVGEEVVTEGLQSLRPGSDLLVTRRTGAQAPSGS